MSKQMPKFQVKNGRRLLSWTLTIAVAALFVNIPNSTGQSQPPQSAEQRAALKEATGLNQQVERLYKEGKYSTAIPLAERVLLIREKVLGKEHPDVATSLEKIKAIFPETTLKLGQSATETAIKQLHSPSILHLATHGFFLSDPEVKLVNDEFGKQPKVLNLENPLLRSGLALAGANNRNQVSSGANDGVLTALEVAGLSLRGTQLVVLSACETGLGDVKVGDGLYGLRRALVIAGSQSQVLSLWKVSDAGTKELMVKYYQGLKAGKGRHEALRDAQLEMLKNPSYQHPFYWASFVPSGDWTPLHKW